MTQIEIEKTLFIQKPHTAKMIYQLNSQKLGKIELSSSLIVIINESLQQGIFPDQLKVTRIYPKYKNKTKDLSWQKLVKRYCFKVKRLLQHLEHYKLLAYHQNRFLKGRLTKHHIRKWKKNSSVKVRL